MLVQSAPHPGFFTVKGGAGVRGAREEEEASPGPFRRNKSQGGEKERGAAEESWAPGNEKVGRWECEKESAERMSAEIWDLSTENSKKWTVYSHSLQWRKKKEESEQFTVAVCSEERRKWTVYSRSLQRRKKRVNSLQSQFTVKKEESEQWTVQLFIPSGMTDDWLSYWLI